MSSTAYILEMKGISKSFPGVKALSGVSFNCLPGQVHALVGENGAGKSTLMKILAGVHQPDEGEIVLRGQEVKLHNPREAQRLGMSIIYQEFNLVPYMTVAQNIMLGREPRTALRTIDRKKLNAQARYWLDMLHIDLNPRLTVEQLTVAQQQIVEIVKALSYDAEIIVMDEPTAALTPHEVANLFHYIELLKARGKTIIFISHRLDEIFMIADWITILKDGAVVTSQPASALSKGSMVQHMVGRELKETFPHRLAGVPGEPVLELRDVSSRNRLHNVSLVVKRGEVVGVAGLEGHGQRELSRLLFGLEPVTAGEVLINGKRVTLHDPIDAMHAGVAFVSDDRKEEGLQLPLSIRKNVSLPSLTRLSRFLFVQERREKQMVRQVADAVDIRAPSMEVEVQYLSGGNQQKTVLAKWLTREPEVLVFGEPTRGIDIGAKVEIYRLMRELAERGKAVVMISSDLLEVIGMSDRIVVLHKGSIAAEMPGATATEESIMRAATGYNPEDEARITAQERRVQQQARIAAQAQAQGQPLQPAQ
jgi:ABC-type sugar transport system ATPase subunit